MYNVKQSKFVLKMTEYLPLTGQSDCPIEAVQAVWRSAGHRCRGAGVYPGHGSPRSCVLQSNYDPDRIWYRTVRQQKCEDLKKLGDFSTVPLFLLSPYELCSQTQLFHGYINTLGPLAGKDRKRLLKIIRKIKKDRSARKVYIEKIYNRITLKTETWLIINSYPS